MAKTQVQELWMKTTDTAYKLGISERTLRAYRDIKGGPLVHGTHWRAGLCKTSALAFEFYGTKKVFNDLCSRRLQSDMIIDQIQEKA